MERSSEHCFFASDLHGRVERYRRLFRAILEEPPAALFLGGDLLGAAGIGIGAGDGAEREDAGGEWLPDGAGQNWSPEDGSLAALLAEPLRRLRSALGDRAPEVFLIPGNDDGRYCDEDLEDGEADGLWHSMHGRKLLFGRHPVFGYAFVPPTPFLLKDWERYDVSRYLDPGACSPEEGIHSVAVPPEVLRYATIQRDLEELAADEDLSSAIFLFHAPPHDTSLDRAALDGVCVDHVPLDLHVGSIAVRRFLEEKGPLISLHGHVHEAARLTGTFRARVGRTYAVSAAHDGPELALVRFSPEDPEGATRVLI
jgi:uncharacterized protein